jgi:BMFP domain-containing protein YqiC
MRHEVEQHMINTLKAWFNQMDLVTREEFDVQTQVLHQCQAKLTALEQQLTAWEAQSTPPNPE